MGAAGTAVAIAVAGTAPTTRAAAGAEDAAAAAAAAAAGAGAADAVTDAEAAATLDDEEVSGSVRRRFLVFPSLPVLPLAAAVGSAYVATTLTATSSLVDPPALLLLLLLLLLLPPPLLAWSVVTVTAVDEEKEDVAAVAPGRKSEPVRAKCSNHWRIRAGVGATPGNSSPAHTGQRACTVVSTLSNPGTTGHGTTSQSGSRLFGGCWLAGSLAFAAAAAAAAAAASLPSDCTAGVEAAAFLPPPPPPPLLPLPAAAVVESFSPALPAPLPAPLLPSTELVLVLVLVLLLPSAASASLSRRHAARSMARNCSQYAILLLTRCCTVAHRHSNRCRSARSCAPVAPARSSGWCRFSSTRTAGSTTA